jgi:sterol desaturase/sphingolipid hydroxylase (fatty acid hydroxylase superfamily)
MKNAIGPLIYVAAMAAVLGLCAAGDRGGSMALVYPAVYLLALGLNVLMTYCWPTEDHRETWSDYRESLIIAFIALAANQILFGPWSGYMPNALAQSFYADGYINFVRNLPVVITLPIAVIAFEGLGYLIHRWVHRGGFIWERVHSAHHEPKSFGAALTIRISYGDYFFHTLVRGSLVGLLQFDPHVLATAMVLSVLGGALCHANTSLKFGWASKIFVTPDFHIWHHDPYRRVNYSFGLFSVFDRWGGTFYLPGDRPRVLGIQNVESARSGWESILMRPLRYASRKAGSQETR